MITQICPKCQSIHQNKGKFCSRSCANSRGPRTSEFKIQVRKKLSYKKTCKIKISPITGRILSRDNPEKSFWDSPSKGGFIIKVSGWFDIELGKYPDTEIQLNNLQRRLFELYHAQGLSSTEIKEYFNIPLPDGHMPAFLKQFGITRRTNSESLINYIAKYGINPKFVNSKYKTGWHTDWTGVDHFYRSGHELELYQILDKKKKYYQTEKLRIKYFDSQLKKYRLAIPDINIGNLIIEIKSDYTLDPINMNDKFMAYRKTGFRPMLILNKQWCPWRESNSQITG